MRNGSSLHPIARSLLGTAAAVVLGASPALAGGPGGDAGAASPTAEASSPPAVGSTPSPTAEDPSAASPTPSPEPSEDVSEPTDVDPSTASPSGSTRADRGTRAGRDLAQAAGSASVAARDNRFVPASITIEVGTTVLWGNEGQAPHTVTANDRAFGSGTLDPGQRFQITFDEVGTVPYYCQIHGEPGSGMTGVVRVVAAAETPDEGSDPSVDPNALPRTGSGAALLALLALGLAALGSLALRAGVRRGRG
jgi:plastocyanin